MVGWTFGVLADDAIRFGWTDQHVVVSVADRPVNEVLAVMSAATGIPMQIDPSLTNRLNGLYRRRTLEDLIMELAPGAAIQYVYDPRLKTHVIEQVFTSGQVDAQTKDRQLRDLVISRERIEAGIIPPVDRPVRYSGIGAALQLTADGAGVLLQPLSPQAPAARAGIRLGDIVTAVDGVPISRYTNTAEIAAAIRGPEDTEVRLTVRTPDGTVRERAVRREVFSWEPPRP